MSTQNENITDAQILANLQSKLEGLVAIRAQTDLQIERAKKAIELYSNGDIRFSANGSLTTRSVSAMIEYNASATWHEKVILILKSQNRPMTTREITDFVVSKEPKLNKDKVYLNVAGTVFQLKGRKQLKGYKPRKMKGEYHASPTWFDKEGNLLKEYEPEHKTESLW